MWDIDVTDKSAGQQKFVKALVGTGKPVVVVAVPDPCDIAYLPACAPTSRRTPTVPWRSRSAVRVITGEVAPTGKLPVDIPVAGNPSSTLSPLGFGIIW